MQAIGMCRFECHYVIIYVVQAGTEGLTMLACALSWGKNTSRYSLGLQFISNTQHTVVLSTSD